MTKDIEREHSKYLAELLEHEVIKKDEFEDMLFKPEINAFHSNYLSARFMDNINFGWSAWQAAKAYEAKKLEGCVVVPVESLNKTIDALESIFEDDPTLALGELLPIQQDIKAMVEAARGGNE